MLDNNMAQTRQYARMHPCMHVNVKDKDTIIEEILKTRRSVT